MVADETPKVNYHQSMKFMWGEHKRKYIQGLDWSMKAEKGHSKSPSIVWNVFFSTTERYGSTFDGKSTAYRLRNEFSTRSVTSVRKFRLEIR